MSSSDTVSAIAIVLINAGFIVGPNIGYFFQLSDILRSGNTAGYARLVSLIILISYTLRIFYYFGEPFEKALLWQAILGVYVHLGMIFTVLWLEKKSALNAGIDSRPSEIDVIVSEIPHHSLPPISESSLHENSPRTTDQLSSISEGAVPSVRPSSTLLLCVPSEDTIESNEIEKRTEEQEHREELHQKETILKRSPFNHSSSFGSPIEKIALSSVEDDSDGMKVNTTQSKRKNNRRVTFEDDLEKREIDFFSVTSTYHSQSNECPNDMPQERGGYCFLLKILFGIEAMIEYTVKGISPWSFLMQYFFAVVCSALFFCLYYFLLSEEVLGWSAGASAVGYAALGCEATLVLPQILKNARRRSTFGLDKVLVLTWVGGDTIKMIYFAALHQPLPFLICGAVQLGFDGIVVMQLVLLPSTPPEDEQREMPFYNPVSNEEMV